VNGKNGGAQPLFLHTSLEENKKKKKENLEKNCTKITWI
jgi:hypothetical protein